MVDEYNRADKFLFNNLKINDAQRKYLDDYLKLDLTDDNHLSNTGTKIHRYTTSFDDKTSLLYVVTMVPEKHYDENRLTSILDKHHLMPDDKEDPSKYMEFSDRILISLYAGKDELDVEHYVSFEIRKNIPFAGYK